MFRIDLIPAGERGAGDTDRGLAGRRHRRHDPAAALAITLGCLVIGSTATIDPYGLVPTGPLRWTVTVVCVGVATALWLWRPAPIDRVSGWWWAGLLFWLLLATLLAVDPLHAWIGTPDRRFGFVAWCTLPLVFLCGQAVRRRADRTLVLRAGALAASVVGVWCAFELAGFSLIGTSFAHHRLGGPFGQPAYLGAAALLIGPTVKSPLSAGMAVQGVHSTANGFILVGRSGFMRRDNAVEMFTSPDGEHWTQVSAPAGTLMTAASGDTVLAQSLAQPNVLATSTDGGNTWSTTDLAAVAGGYGVSSQSGYLTVDVGPLGVAAVFAQSAPNVPEKVTLFFSADGRKWTTTDLKAKGAPNAMPQVVRVGADHVEVVFMTKTGVGDKTKAVALLGTPEAP